jgi:aspartyl-tRNA(Asn)/glutamyl-tRNA(Gln) amidotransferase subunit A
MSISISPTLGVSESAQLLRDRAISSRELVSFFLDRINRHSELNAFISVDGEQALKDADVCDSLISKGESLPLLGVPIAVKDLILAKGSKTTAASRMLSGFKAPYDATVVANLRKAGAVILGKTNLDEFAMGSSNETSFFGPVKNPWGLDRVPGGSSGGSAAAVAARLIPAALGTDTGGSIRQPAALCGVTGLKPTYGRVSRYGVIAYASSLDQVGPFAHNVRDVALLTEVLSGRDPLDATTSVREVPRLTESCGRSIRGLRIGIPKEYFVAGLDPQVERAVRSALDVLVAAGAIPVDISLPHTDSAVSVYYVLAPAEASSNLARYDGVKYGHRASGVASLAEMYQRTRSEGFGKEVRRRIVIGTYVLSSGYYDAYYVRAQKARTLISRDFQEAFQSKCDLILSPVAPTTAFRIGEKVSDPLAMYLNDIFTIPVNLAGRPGMSLPCGFDDAGLPIGLQLIGRQFDEDTLLRVAAAYESETSWHQRYPERYR